MRKNGYPSFWILKTKDSSVNSINLAIIRTTNIILFKNHQLIPLNIFANNAEAEIIGL